MTERRIIAEYCNSGMLNAMRARARERKIALSSEDTRDVAGLASRYLRELIGANPIRRIGAISLGPVLAILGVRLAMIVDADALERMERGPHSGTTISSTMTEWSSW